MKKTEKSKPVRYPWAKWFSKSSLSLVQGRDFHCQAHGMIQQLRNKALALGITIHITTTESYINVTIERGKHAD